MMEFVLVAHEMLVPNSNAHNNPVSASESISLDLLRVTTRVGRTEENVLAAGMNSATGAEAARKAGLQTSPQVERSRTSTGASSQDQRGGRSGHSTRPVQSGQGGQSPSGQSGQDGSHGQRSGARPNAKGISKQGKHEDFSDSKLGRTRSVYMLRANPCCRNTAEINSHPPVPFAAWFTPSPPTSVSESLPQSFTQAWISSVSTPMLGPEEVVMKEVASEDETTSEASDNKTSSTSSTASSSSSSSSSHETSSITDYHIKALDQKYNFQCLSRHGFTQVLRTARMEKGRNVHRPWAISPSRESPSSV